MSGGYVARWRGPADPPAALLTLTACRFTGTLEDAQAEALLALGVELVPCCFPEDGEPCRDCREEIETRRDRNRTDYLDATLDHLAGVLTGPRRDW